MSPQKRGESGRSVPERDDSGPVQVNPLTVPALFGGMLLGLGAGYMLGWWGLFIVGAVVLAALSMVITGKPRDVASALLLGTCSAYVIVILLAVFRGVI